MDGNFVADVRLDDSDEVLQLPIVKNKVKKLLQGAVRKIALLGAPVIPSSDDSLEQFLQSAGRFFGKDPAKWDQVGDTKVDVSEENGKRTTKLTGVFTGTELGLLVENPYFDERLPARDDKPELNFNVKRRFVRDDDEWQEIISDQPWTASKRRQMLAAYLHAKVEADEPALQAEGAHGFWELALNKEHHMDIRLDRLAALLNRLSSPSIEVATTAAAAVWGLATTGLSRKSLADLDVVTLVLSNIKRTLKMATVPDVPSTPGGANSDALQERMSLQPTNSTGGAGGDAERGAALAAGAVPESQRTRYQSYLQGALSVLLIDRNCRRAYLQQEPDFATLFMLAKNLDGYSPVAAAARREAACKLLTSMVQRDADARRSLIVSGALRSVIQLLNPKGPGESMVQFCAASLLATLVLDDDAMDVIKERGEAPTMFEACIVLLQSTLTKLKREVKRFFGQLTPEELEEEGEAFDVELGVRLAEAASQAMWGSAHYCVMMDPIQVKMADVVQLGNMGTDCYTTVALPLSRVAHCITATLATLSANPDAAMLIMQSPDDVALGFLMAMLDAVETENFERAGHVKASACAGIAFLACHPIGAEGDECMVGPFRLKLLSLGAFGALLRAALTSVLDAECDRIIQQAAAIGVMYLSTMAGAVDSAELAMYAALLMDSDNSEMIEFLMAGMWILLRNGDNRKVLGTSFNPSPANALAKNMMHKLNDAITLHEINDEVANKTAAMRTAMQGGGQQHESVREDSPSPEGEGDMDGERSESVSVRDSRSQSPALQPQGSAAAGSIAGDAGRDAGGLGVEEGVAAAAALEDQEALAEEQQQQQQQEPAAEGSQPLAPAADQAGDAPSEAPAEPSQPPAQQEGGGEASAPAVAAEISAVSAGQEEDDESALPDAEELAQREASQFLGSTTEIPAGENMFDKLQDAKQQGDDSAAAFPSAMMLKRNRRQSMAVREKAEAMKGKMAQLEKRFDKQLKDNWGLETLVTVGESWLPAMLEQDAVGEANDVPVLKLFEFLVASICMFMVEDDGRAEPRELDVFRLSAPDGAKNKTWWTVDARAPEPDGNVDANTERALRILLQILGMHLRAAWKSLQLGVLTLWNACCRNASMERHVVERDVSVKLMLIANNPSWPPSLRDISAGFMEYLQERYSNLGTFAGVTTASDGPYGLPAGSEWPLPGPPADGVVPFVAVMVGLINTRVPLMEYRGCHGLARMTYAAPYGCPEPAAFHREVKAVAAALGAIEALISLLKRLNRRYQDFTSPGGGAGGGTGGRKDESAAYERDMANLEATQDVYFVSLASLVNLSVLKSNQVPIAKRGLLVLLGTNTLLYNRVVALRAGLNAMRPGAPGAAQAADGLAREEQLLNLCSAVIQNISLHPHNRTRLYKAELKGSVALDKVIENAADVDDETRTAASFLPSIQRTASPTHAPGGPRAAWPANSPKGPVASVAATSTRGRGQLSPNGAVLNQSVDTALAGAVRPKVVFPPIVERREDDRVSHYSTSPRFTTVGAASCRIPSAAGSARSTSPPGGMPNDSYDGASASGQGLSHEALTDSRYRFLTWIDNTFHELEAGGSAQPFARGRGGGAGLGGPGGGDDTASKKSHRKQLWDERGEWLSTEPEGFKALNKLLSRPLSHLWQDTPEHRARQGKQRWEPVVSEYREAKQTKPLTRPAAKLLSTLPPQDEEELLVAAGQLMQTGIVEGVESDPVPGHEQAMMSWSQGLPDELAMGDTGGVTIDADGNVIIAKPKTMPAGTLLNRPATRERDNGRVGLTVLQPNPEAVAATLARRQAEGDDSQDGSRSGSPRDGSRGRGEGKGGDGSGGDGSASPARSAVPLKVCMGPKRPRQVITFEDRIVIDADGSRPSLVLFEHVEGSKVSEGLFPSYVLPNGKRAHMYYAGGTLLDEVSVEAVVPPPRPSTVPQALQQTMPLANVLNLIAKPPGSAPPFIPYKPVPRLVPLPGSHTLTVKRPDMADRPEAYGDLREDNLQLVIQAKKIIKTQTTTKVESIEVKALEEREPWTLPNSIFKSRTKECDARAFFDSHQVEEKMFERDWQRACAKEKFTSMMSRENKANKEGKDDKVAIKEVHDVLLKYYAQLFGAFVYFAAGGSSDPYHMSLNAFTSLLDECAIADPDSQFCKRSDCDTVFIVCNFQPDKKSAEAQVNVENAMMRYEFLEAIVRLALSKYGKGQETDDIALAVQMLIEHNIIGHLGNGPMLVSNTFRTDRLYNEEVDLVFKRHSVLLKALYSRYRLKPTGGGLRPKVLKLDGWLQLMSDAHLVDSQFTLADAALAFLWARMYVVDEIKDYARYTCLSFVDFLEALGRVADMKSLPAASDLDIAGYDSILDWALDKERMEGGPMGGQGGGGGGGGGGEGGGEGGPTSNAPVALDIFRPRPSAGFDAPKNRPLYVKLELLLDLVFRRLFWDPSQPEVSFNVEGLLKLVKKVDKDLGP